MIDVDNGGECHTVFDHPITEKEALRMLATAKIEEVKQEIDDLLNAVQISDYNDDAITAVIETLIESLERWRQVHNNTYGVTIEREVHHHNCDSCLQDLVSKSGELYWCGDCAELFWNFDGFIESRKSIKLLGLD